MRFDRDYAQTTAAEYPEIRVVVFAVGNIQPLHVDIEGIRIFHEKLPHAQQAGFRARFVAEFRLDLVPDLRQLFVAADFAARDRGHDLFMCHPEAQIAPKAVLEAEHVLTHGVPAAGFLPELRGMERGQMHLLGADSVHFLAHDALDFVQRALREKQVAVDTGSDLTDIAGAQEETMARRLRFGGIIAQRGDEELAPEHDARVTRTNSHPNAARPAPELRSMYKVRLPKTVRTVLRTFSTSELEACTTLEKSAVRFISQ